jgi:sugar phosphate isomerase/epimerase
MAHPLSIDHLTSLGARAEEMVEIAAELGCEFIGPMIDPSRRKVIACFELEDGGDEARAFAAALERTGVRVNNVDYFPLTPVIDWDDYKRSLDIAARVRARGVVVLAYDDDAGRCLDSFCRLAEEAKALGLGLALEFMPSSQVKTCPEAADFLRRARQANAGLLIDALHLFNSGGGAAEVAALDPALIWGAQICDGPLGATREAYAHASRFERERPGEGQFPLPDFIAALPEGVAIGIEVPRQTEMDQGLSPLERARLAVEATRAQVLKAELRAAS